MMIDGDDSCLGTAESCYYEGDNSMNTTLGVYGYSFYLEVLVVNTELTANMHINMIPEVAGKGYRVSSSDVLMQKMLKFRHPNFNIGGASPLVIHECPQRRNHWTKGGDEDRPARGLLVIHVGFVVFVLTDWKTMINEVTNRVKR